MKHIILSFIGVLIFYDKWKCSCNANNIVEFTREGLMAAAVFFCSTPSALNDCSGKRLYLKKNFKVATLLFCIFTKQNRDFIDFGSIRMVDTIHLPLN